MCVHAVCTGSAYIDLKLLLLQQFIVATANVGILTDYCYQPPYCLELTQEKFQTSALAGLKDANPTIRPYATGAPIQTAHRATAPHSDCPTATCI